MRQISNENIGTVTLYDAAIQFVEYKATDFFKGTKPTTTQRIRMTAKMIMKYDNCGECLLTSITEEYLRKMLSDLSREYSYSTVKKVFEFFKAMYTWMYKVLRIGIFKENPTTFIMLPKDKRVKSISTLTKTECHRLYVECMRINPLTGDYAHRYGPAYIFMLNTGLRAGEMSGLSPDDLYLDVDIPFVRISKTSITVPVEYENAVEDSECEKTEIWKTVVQDSPKSMSGYRTIPLNETAEQMARIMIEQYSKFEERKTLICTSTGKPVSPANMTKYLKSALESAGIPVKGGCHMLRDTFTTLAIENKVPLAYLSLVLGHSNTKITYENYIQISREAAAKELAIVELN